MTAASSSNYQNNSYVQTDLKQLDEARGLVQGALKSADPKQVDEVDAKIKQIIHTNVGHNILNKELGKLHFALTNFKMSLDEEDPNIKYNAIKEIGKWILSPPNAKEKASAQVKLIGELEREEKTTAALNQAVDDYNDAVADNSQRGIERASLKLATLYLFENKATEIDHDFTDALLEDLRIMQHNNEYIVLVDTGRSNRPDSDGDFQINETDVGRVPKAKIDLWAKEMLAIGEQNKKTQA